MNVHSDTLERGSLRQNGTIAADPSRPAPCEPVREGTAATGAPRPHRFGGALALSVLDQAVLSAANLLLNLVLIGQAGPVAFGGFALALALTLVATALQAALVTTPLAVLPAPNAASRARLLGTLFAMDIGVRAAAALAVALVMGFARGDLEIALAAGFFAWTTLRRETLRSLLFRDGAAGRCLRLDLTATLTGALTVAALWMVADPLVAALAGWAAGNLVATLLHAPLEHTRRRGVRATLAAYRPIWRDMRWSLLGAGVTEAQNRIYVFALEAAKGAATLGAVQAGRVLLGPLALLASAWGRVARPRMAALLESGDARGAKRVLGRGLLVVSAGGLPYLGLLALAWAWIEPVIYKGRYPEVALHALLWGVVALFNVLQLCLGYYLQAARRFRSLAAVTAGVALASTGLIVTLFLGAPPSVAIVAVAVGEAIALVWSAVLVWRDGRGCTR